MVAVESLVDEFYGRLEDLDYLSRSDALRVNFDAFEAMSDTVRDRASMILSSIIAYGLEPSDYYYNERTFELLLEYADEDFVAVFSLIKLGLKD